MCYLRFMILAIVNLAGSASSLMIKSKETLNAFDERIISASGYRNNAICYAVLGEGKRWVCLASMYHNVADWRRQESRQLYKLLFPSGRLDPKTTS